MKNREDLIHIIKFTVFSISAGLIQLGSFAILNESLSWPYWPSYLISLTLSVLWNFTLNRKFTFKSAANIPVAMIKVAIFYLIFTPLTTWGGNYLDQVGWNEYLILAITMILNFVTEFIYTKYFVYRQNINTAINNKKIKLAITNDDDNLKSRYEEDKPN